MVWRSEGKGSNGIRKIRVLRKSPAQGIQSRNSNSKIQGRTSQALVRRGSTSIKCDRTGEKRHRVRQRQSPAIRDYQLIWDRGRETCVHVCAAVCRCVPVCGQRASKRKIRG